MYLHTHAHTQAHPYSHTHTYTHVGTRALAPILSLSRSLTLSLSLSIERSSRTCKETSVATVEPVGWVSSAMQNPFSPKENKQKKQKSKNKLKTIVQMHARLGVALLLWLSSKTHAVKRPWSILPVIPIITSYGTLKRHYPSVLFVIRNVVWFRVKDVPSPTTTGLAFGSRLLRFFSLFVGRKHSIQ